MSPLSNEDFFEPAELFYTRTKVPPLTMRELGSIAICIQGFTTHNVLELPPAVYAEMNNTYTRILQMFVEAGGKEEDIEC